MADTFFSSPLPAGYVASSATLAGYAITADQWGDLTSISLPAGQWEVSTNSEWFSNGGTTTTVIATGVSTTAGNSSTGLTNGDNRTRGTKTQTTQMSDTLAMAANLVSPTTTTTYYMKAFAGTSITNLQIAFRISARRVG